MAPSTGREGIGIMQLFKKYSKITVSILLAVTMIASVPVSVFAQTLPSDTTNQINCNDPLSAESLDDFLSLNDIVWFNPCSPETTCGTATSAGIMGANNAEKIWNYYANKGLTAIAIAGIMGNFKKESTEALDPAIKQGQTTKAMPSGGDGYTGYGLAQWTYITRQAGLFKRMDAAGLSQYYGAGFGAVEADKDIPAADLDKLLQVELDYTWDNDVEGMTVSKMATTLNGYQEVGAATQYFHNKYEQSADTVDGLIARTEFAKEYLSAFEGTSASSASLVAPSGDACTSNSSLGGVSSVEDAMVWARKFISDTEAKYSISSSLSYEYVHTSSPSYGTFEYIWRFSHSTPYNCWHAADCGQCTALSGWFINTQTDLGSRYLGGNGGQIVRNLAAIGVPTSKTPLPFSVFSADSGSSWGHTGVVLGVLANGDVITIEDNADGNGSISIWQGNFDARYGAGKTTFANLNDHLTNEAAAAAGSVVTNP